MNDIKPVTIINDNPEEDSIMFGFHTYAKTITELIVNKDNATPLVIGIYGSWGSGKTTLMALVRNQLKSKVYADKKRFRYAKTIWFQAWKYGNENEILAALIEEIFKTMKKDGFFQACKAKIEELVKQYKPSKVIEKLTDLTGFNITELFAGLEYKDKLGFYDTFQDFFDRLIWDYLNWRPKNSKGQLIDDRDGVLVIFIDDLDRCPNDRIVKVLETIKLFMDKKGCVFVIGAAKEIIEKALANQYGEKDAGKFMDKIVQVTFNLPQIQIKDFESFIKEKSPGINEKISPHLPLIIPTMKNNPRQLKRFLNNLSLQAGIISNKEDVDIDFNTLLYWSIIEYAHPLLWNEIKDNPQILILLQKHSADLENSLGRRSIHEISDDDLKDVPRSLWKHLRTKDLMEIVKSFKVNEDILKTLISFSAIVESTEDMKLKKPDKIITGFDDMVEILEGIFLYGDDKTKKEIKSPYMIGIYSVTNDQYERFIKAGGYDNESYWSPEGNKWKKQYNIIQPKYWEDEQLNKEGHPVVGVSFYEAKAYAKWDGKRLPTEEEWERAARGTDGREYPWGNEFDKEKCNSVESGIGGTTRVTRYPNVTSSIGCYDMAGNVWEWASSLNREGGSYRVLCGGGWYDNAHGCRSAIRRDLVPGYRNLNIGFRLSRTV